eukprot:4480982-Pyramimonas_sp.AAC.1
MAVSRGPNPRGQHQRAPPRSPQPRAGSGRPAYDYTVCKQCRYRWTWNGKSECFSCGRAFAPSPSQHKQPE